ncbi:MAG: tetratricopeptide repeat protein, partial [Elainella sp. Prado103]|nr:tetratricopeptide repeat protein [Elainella sp. Prado103]
MNLIPIVLPIDLLSRSFLLPGGAQTEVDRIIEADQLLQKGAQQYEANQFQDALESFEQALKIYKETGSYSQQIVALSNIGVTYRRLSRYSKALQA